MEIFQPLLSQKDLYLVEANSTSTPKKAGLEITRSNYLANQIGELTSAICRIHTQNIPLRGVKYNNPDSIFILKTQNIHV